MNLSRRHKISTIKKKDEIRYILDHGKRISTKFGPIFFYSFKSDENFKAAILLKRNCGSAVKRNKIKRFFRNYIKDVFSGSEKYNRIIMIYGYKKAINYQSMIDNLRVVKNYL